MSVPKKRQTSSRGKRRRSHSALKSVKLSGCPKCKKPIKPHNACSYCGYYRGRAVVSVERDKRREQEKEKLKRT